MTAIRPMGQVEIAAARGTRSRLISHGRCNAQDSSPARIQTLGPPLPWTTRARSPSGCTSSRSPSPSSSPSAQTGWTAHARTATQTVHVALRKARGLVVETSPGSSAPRDVMDLGRFILRARAAREQWLADGAAYDQLRAEHAPKRATAPGPMFGELTSGKDVAAVDEWGHADTGQAEAA